MVHGINYPDETGRNQMEVRLWNPVMKNGIIKFLRPDQCTIVKRIRTMKPKAFDRGNIQPVSDLWEKLEMGDPNELAP